MTHFDPKVTPWSIDENEFPANGSPRDKMEFLIRYAVLAPSSHNTEPWQFRLRDDAIDVLIDHSRWLKVADADQRELHISVGCALENLLIAAEHFGLGHSALLMPDASDPLLAAPEGGLIPQHPFRMGFARAEKEHTPRRPLAQVIVS